MQGESTEPSSPSLTCFPNPCRVSSAWRWCWRRRGSGCWSRSCWSPPQSWKKERKKAALDAYSSSAPSITCSSRWMPRVFQSPVSLVRLPGFVSRVHQVLDVVVWSDGELGQIFDVGSHQWVLSDAQVSFVLGIQQVTHALTVDLHVTHLQEAKSSVSNSGQKSHLNKSKDILLIYYFG